MKKSLQIVLQEKADQVRAGTEILVAKTRDWQVIKAYLNNRLGDMLLTEEQEKKLERYQYIYNNLVSQKYSEYEVVNQVVKLFKIELVQAYEDLNHSKEIFVSTLSINKRFEQKMELESARSLKRKCEEMHDFKAAAQIQKNIVLILRDLPEEEENPGELFEGHSYEILVDPRLIGAKKVDRQQVLDAINERRTKKITNEIFDDLPFEEVKNNS